MYTCTCTVHVYYNKFNDPTLSNVLQTYMYMYQLHVYTCTCTCAIHDVRALFRKGKKEKERKLQQPQRLRIIESAQPPRLRKIESAQP